MVQLVIPEPHLNKMLEHLTFYSEPLFTTKIIHFFEKTNYNETPPNLPDF
jgi:hypothetical protein